MTVASLTDVLVPAFEKGYGVVGLVVLGWEDACAFVAAAEELTCPVILQAGPGCRAHTPVSILGPMFRALAEKGINIQMISTSEIKISVTIDREYTELAVRTLHNAFELEKIEQNK